MLKRTILFWFFAVLITVAAAYYQRITGPTHPLPAAVTFGDSKFSFELIRTHGGEEDAEIRLAIPDEKISGELYFRRFRVDNEWKIREFTREDGGLVAWLPHQPPAGKPFLFEVVGYPLSASPHIIKGEVLSDNAPPAIGAKFNGVNISNLPHPLVSNLFPPMPPSHLLRLSP